MADKKSIQYKERILRYLLRNGSVQNTFKIARELGIKREETLLILNELAKEGKVKLMHGSVKAVTKELSQKEIVKTKSEVEELKERVDKLEKWIGLTFRQLDEAIHIGYKKILEKNKSKGKTLVNQEEVKIKI